MRRIIYLGGIGIASVVLVIVFLVMFPQPVLVPNNPKAPEPSTTIELLSDEAIDAFFAGLGGDGLAWETAYLLANRIVNGQGLNSCIRFWNTSRYVVIQNCTLTSGRVGILIENCTNVKILNCTAKYNIGHGILVNNSQQCNISGNIAENNGADGITLWGARICNLTYNMVSASKVDGISLHYSSNCTVITNNPHHNAEDGIYLYHSPNCTVQNNDANQNGDDGIHLNSADNCTLILNDLANNIFAAISLDYSDSCVLSNNTIIGYSYGILLLDSLAINCAGNILSGEGFTWIGNNARSHIDETNLVNGLPVYFYENQTFLDITGLDDVGQLFLINCNDSRISNLNIQYATQALTLISCQNNTISGNTFARNTFKGIYLQSSSNNTIQGNNISIAVDQILNSSHYVGSGINVASSQSVLIIGNKVENYERGIYLYMAYNCRLAENQILNNIEGILLRDSHENTLFQNIIYGNGDGIIFSYSDSNLIEKNSFLDNNHHAIRLEGSNYNTISDNFLPEGQCIYQDDNCNGNGGKDLEDHSCAEPLPDWIGEIVPFIVMLGLALLQYFTSRKVRKAARERKKRYKEARKTQDPSLRDFYRVHHGFDPIDDCKKGRFGISHFEEEYALESDPPLIAAGVTIAARVDFFSDGRSSNRIVFRRGKRKASVACTHTIIYNGPVDTALAIHAAIEAGSKNVMLPQIPKEEYQETPDVSRPAQNPKLAFEQPSENIVRETKAGSGKPADLLPWEHFAALKSYVAALAEQGITNLLANSFTSEDNNPSTLSTGFNAAMQQQILRALARIGPKHVTAIILASMLEHIVSDEGLLNWFYERFQVVNDIYRILDHIQMSPDIQAIFVMAIEKWGVAHIPEKILFILATSPQLSDVARAEMCQLPNIRLQKMLKIKNSHFVEHKFRKK